MDRNTCEIHGTPLKETNVPIRYGLPAYNPATEIESELFPHAHSYTLGGCMIDDVQERVTLPVCEECRLAEKAWREKYDVQTDSSIFDITVSEA